MFVYQHVALNPNLPGILFEPWQLFTYAFLHLSPGMGGLLHILFNMLWMIWIGREYEQMHGARQLFAIYILGGVGGALLTVGLHAIFPNFGPFGGIIHGASGSVLGIMAAVGLQYPQKTIALIFIGTVRVIHVVFGFVFLDILFLSAGGTSVSAHAGGILTGFIWAKSAHAGIDLSGWANIFYPNGTRAGYGATKGGSSRGGFLQQLEGWFEQRNQSKDRSTPTRPTSTSTTQDNLRGSSSSRVKDIDSILDKISEKGYDSLSAAEKRALYEASKED